MAAAFFALLLVAFLVFLAHGGRYFIVETPSMGQTAPVGSLVFSTPVQLSQLRVGDIISFHPSTSPRELYTHRIVAIKAAGLTTRGDNNGIEDPWLVTQSSLVGQVHFVAKGLGWILRCLPLMVLGTALVWFSTRYLRSPTQRAAGRIGGYAFVFAMTIAIVRPFVRILLLTATAAHGRAHATIVSTGILPIRVSAVGGSFVHLVSGQIGGVSVRTVAKAHYQVGADLDLSPVGWVIFFACCSIPLLWILVVGLPSNDAERKVAPA